jgi:hypothetical protein
MEKSMFCVMFYAFSDIIACKVRGYTVMRQDKLIHRSLHKIDANLTRSKPRFVTVLHVSYIPINNTTHPARQERINEKFTIRVPSPKLPKPNRAIMQYIGKRVRILLKDGNILVGTPVRQQLDYIRLTNIDEISNGMIIKADWITIHPDSILRIYPANAVVMKQ